MFLKFYVISTVVSYLILVLAECALKARYERESKKKIPKLRRTISEKILNFLPIFIPFCNIFMALIAIFAQEHLYKKLKQEVKKWKIGRLKTKLFSGGNLIRLIFIKIILEGIEELIGRLAKLVKKK